MSDMDKVTLVLLAIALLCVIALLVIGAALEPEPQISLIMQIMGGPYGRS